MGLASRTAALWAIEKANGNFKNTFGAKLWLSNHEQQLAQRDFWQSDDQHLLWNRFVMREEVDSPREWRRLQFALDVQWSGVPLPPQALVRVISKADRTGLVCSSDLRPMGRYAMPFDGTAWHTEAVMGDDGKLMLTLHGPATYAVN